MGDYEDAVTEETAAFLKVHRSNFRITGFTHEAGLAELAEAAARHGVPLLYDLGSGCLLDSAEYGLAHEPTPAEAVREGADVVMFSGDKLLGGPQAGIVVGKSRYIDILKKHPLVRAMRIDKATMAALQMTLLHYLRGEAAEKLPIWRMNAAPPAALDRRAKRLRQGRRAGRGGARRRVGHRRRNAPWGGPAHACRGDSARRHRSRGHGRGTAHRLTAHRGAHRA